MSTYPGAGSQGAGGSEPSSPIIPPALTSDCQDCGCRYQWHGAGSSMACNWCGCRAYVPLFSPPAIDGNARRKPQGARVMQ